MAVKLRLMRMGKTKQPTYRVVAADSRSPRNGRFIEIGGTYEPREEPSKIVIDNEKAVAHAAAVHEDVLRFATCACVLGGAYATLQANRTGRFLEADCRGAKILAQDCRDPLFARLWLEVPARTAVVRE